MYPPGVMTSLCKHRAARRQGNISIEITKKYHTNTQPHIFETSYTGRPHHARTVQPFPKQIIILENGYRGDKSFKIVLLPSEIWFTLKRKNLILGESAILSK